MSPAKKTATKKTTTRKTTRRKRGPAEPRGPEARESALDRGDEHIVALTDRVEKAKGSVLAAYRDPYAGLPLVLASLPIGTVEATPFQRDLSKTHADRLAVAIGASGLFLDPVIAIPSADSRASGPRGAAGPRLRLVVFRVVVFFVAVFFAGLMTPLLLVRLLGSAGAVPAR